MLQELRVENLLLLDRAELRLAAGLNVLTGETGAGKTLLAHALDLLLGGRARSAVVRGGAAEAYVEGVFSLPPELGGREELLPAGAEEIVLARRVWPDGRTRAYVCGRSATVGDLRELGSRLLTFYGQHEHRKLMLATAQLDILDFHCGAEQLERRAGVASAYERVRGLEDRVEQLRELAGARERELDLLAFELREIEAAAPREDEAAGLAEERERLRHAETLRGSAAAAAESIFPDGETGAPDGDAGAAQALALAGRQLEAGAAIDPALAALTERLRALAYEAEDAGRELRSYALGVEGAPGRLEEVEERLALLARLERKHGGSIEEVLRHAERCRERIAELEGAEVALGDAEAEWVEARSGLDALARELGERRRQAAPRLARAVRERLAELAMPDARFEVELGPRPDGCGPRGADTVELLISTNAGVPAGALREIASGGELSRVMLALLSVAHGGARHAHAHGGARPAAAAAAGPAAAQAPLLVFDEIDAGIGGHTARAVGEHLRELAVGRQILCITHLPQVAALAARHFTIDKDSATVPATTTVTALDGKAVVNELVRMLGAGEGDRAASQHARQLLRRAA
jgi:DNA repair protein RecN (Recombination protein N)